MVRTRLTSSGTTTTFSASSSLYSMEQGGNWTGNFSTGDDLVYSWGNTSITINPSVYKKLPYDPLRDYDAVTQITSGAYMLVVHPSIPAKTVPEFIALAKKRPGDINYASTGANNLLAMEMFNHMAGVKILGINMTATRM